MVYLACIHFCIPCCIPFNVYFWCVLVRTHYNEYTKTIRIPQSLCIHDSIQSVRFKYTFPIRRLKYTISIQKYTFYRLHPPPPVFYLFSYTSLSTHNTVFILPIPLYTQQLHTICIHTWIPHCAYIHSSCILSAYTHVYPIVYLPECGRIQSLSRTPQQRTEIILRVNPPNTPKLRDDKLPLVRFTESGHQGWAGPPMEGAPFHSLYPFHSLPQRHTCCHGQQLVLLHQFPWRLLDGYVLRRSWGTHERRIGIRYVYASVRSVRRILSGYAWVCVWVCVSMRKYA